MLKYLWRSANTERLFLQKNNFLQKEPKKLGGSIRDKE